MATPPATPHQSTERGWLTVWQRLSLRLGSSDMTQVLLAFFAVLLFMLLASWPPNGQASNDSWYSVVQSKAVALALLSLAYGNYMASESAADQVYTLLALWVFQLLALPLDVATYAASYPSVALWWPPLLLTLHIGACFSLGILSYRLLHFLRLGLLHPLSTPLLLFGLIWLDIAFEQSIFSPLSTTVTPSLGHVLFNAGMCLLLWPLLRSVALGANVQPHA